jgi:hypothetical protein
VRRNASEVMSAFESNAAGILVGACHAALPQLRREVMRRLIMIVIAVFTTTDPVLADGLLLPPQQAYPPRPSQSCGGR